MTTHLLSLTDVQIALDEGDLDDDLDALVAAVARRRMQLGVGDIAVGARGVLKNGKPLYLNGAPFTVKKINPKRIVVNLDQDWLDAHPQATRWAGDITAPRGMLDFSVSV